jgi:hypothetical protein
MIYARVNRTIDTQAAPAQTAGCFFLSGMICSARCLELAGPARVRRAD